MASSPRPSSARRGRCQHRASLTFPLLIATPGAASLQTGIARLRYPPTGFCLLGSVAGICRSVNANRRPGRASPPIQPCATSASQSFCELSASSRYFHYTPATASACGGGGRRRLHFAVRIGGESYGTFRSREAGGVVIFSLVSKQCVKPCSAEAGASVSLRMTEAVPSPGEV